MSDIAFMHHESIIVFIERLVLKMYASKCNKLDLKIINKNMAYKKVRHDGKYVHNLHNEQVNE